MLCSAALCCRAACTALHCAALDNAMYCVVCLSRPGAVLCCAAHSLSHDAVLCSCTLPSSTIQRHTVLCCIFTLLYQTIGCYMTTCHMRCCVSTRYHQTHYIHTTVTFFVNFSTRSLSVFGPVAFYVSVPVTFYYVVYQDLLEILYSAVCRKRRWRGGLLLDFLIALLYISGHTFVLFYHVRPLAITYSDHVCAPLSRALIAYADHEKPCLNDLACGTWNITRTASSRDSSAFLS